MRTVYVIGAGASVEADLPDGESLKKEISRLLNISVVRAELKSGDKLVATAIDNYRSRTDRHAPIDTYFQAARQVQQILPLFRSIDHLLNSRRDDQKIAACSKIAIARAVLAAESKSKLCKIGHSRSRRSDYSALEDTWYNSFFHSIASGCVFEELKERLGEITFVIFNYDRCFEHFLFNAILDSYPIETDDAAALVSSLSIHHPYGMAGALPWQSAKPQVEFGGDPTANDLIQIAEQINTFSEGTMAEEAEIQAIRKAVANTMRLVFLGFAYYEINMDILRPEPSDLDRSRQTVRCLGTSYGISESNTAIIRSRVSALYKSSMSPTLSALTCNRFFADHSERLSY